MDTTQKIKSFLAVACLIAGSNALAQPSVENIQFCDRSYQYGIGNDSIKVFFNLLDSEGKKIPDLSLKEFENNFYFNEDGKDVENREICQAQHRQRIPHDYTFSILLDQSIPQEGKHQILDAISQILEIAPDSSVFISRYGDSVSSSIMVTSDNWNKFQEQYMQPIEGKAFYSGIFAKLNEFSPTPDAMIGQIKASAEYKPNQIISQRAIENPNKNLLIVFAEGNVRPDDDDELDFMKVTDYQTAHLREIPKVYAFYYTADGSDPSIDITLEGITEPKDTNHEIVPFLRGDYLPSDDMQSVISKLAEVVENTAYDYQIAYRATQDKIYTGNVEYSAKWGRNKSLGSTTFTIGSVERPWPEKEKNSTGMIVEILVALLVTILTLIFYLFIMKVVVPYINFWQFKRKYYIKYQPQENVSRRICHYCKQELKPGQIIVAKCSHWMHKHCWEENDYKCAEFGQNCKTGIQNHVVWNEIFSLSTLKECTQTISGVLAGLASWFIYELCGRGGFEGLSHWIVGLVFGSEDSQAFLINDCVARTSSFLMIGLLLGFFISLVFRYNDDIRNKSLMVCLRIIGLSILTAFVGMLAFAIGADIFCLILSWTGLNYIPWYCSLPAYVLFSISVSLALTIQSTIPIKSALLGGLISAVIGFLVLYFTKFTSQSYAWLNMLLDFIIYGGGLGASLVTVRMLAEKYFLVIQNGVRQGMRIPIHKWMNATGGGNKVSIGATGDCEIQMNWEKSNKVAKEHAKLYVDYERQLPVIKPLATGVLYNNRAELPVNKPSVLSNGDFFKIGDTIFKYEEV